MEVAIISSTIDLHSEVVRWSMEQAGVRCRVLDTLYGLHSQDGNSLALDDEPSSRGEGCDTNVRAAWYRRHHKVRSPASEECDENKIFRTSECNIMQENVIATLAAAPDVAWINNPGRARFAEHKFLQLVHAKRSGLSVPATLMSAEPSRIRTFARSYDAVVVKPFGVYSWKRSDQSQVYALASKIDANRIINSSDGALSNTPAIYQAAINKSSDLRVVIMGDHVYAYNIIQTGTPDFDCRFAMSDSRKASIEEYTLTKIQEEKILNMMKSLGIDIASADFALTASGDIVFLDLNPAGAWLFLEERVPEISLTKSLCRLLAEKAGLRSSQDFPSYEAFTRSSAAEAFNQRFRFEAEHGLTVLNDRTWTAAA